MPAKHVRIAHQQHLAPCAGHAHVHAAYVRQKVDLALGVAARQGDGNDVALLALKRIDVSHAEPALQQRGMQPSKAPCVPPRFGSCPCVRPHRLASGPLLCVLQSVRRPAQTRALVRHRLGERRVNLKHVATKTAIAELRNRDCLNCKILYKITAFKGAI